MIDPVTLSAMASSFANGFASALGSEAGKALFNGQCHCSQEDSLVFSLRLAPQDNSLPIRIRRGVVELPRRS